MFKLYNTVHKLLLWLFIQMANNMPHQQFEDKYIYGKYKIINLLESLIHKLKVVEVILAKYQHKMILIQNI